MPQMAQLWSSISGLIVVDALIVAAIFGGVMLYAFTIGNQRLLTAYFAVGAAGLLTLLLPSLAQVPYLSTWFEYQRDLLLFIVSTAVFLIILWQNRFFDPYIVPSGIEKIFFALGLAGWIIVILGAIVPHEMLGVSAPVQTYFFSWAATLGWLLAPLGFFLIFRGRV